MCWQERALLEGAPWELEPASMLAPAWPRYVCDAKNHRSAFLAVRMWPCVPNGKCRANQCGNCGSGRKLLRRELSSEKQGVSSGGIADLGYREAGQTMRAGGYGPRNSPDACRP